MKRVLQRLSVAMALGLALGCGQPTPPAYKDTSAGTASKEQPTIAVNVTDESGLQQAIKRHRGKVVLVDFWATWCPPCKELFPHTVDLHRRLAPEGLAVISVSLDDPAMESQVLDFLREQSATFENFLSRYGASPQSTEAFQIQDDTLPYLALYDRDGNLQRTFGGGQGVKANDVDQAVEGLLQSPSPGTEKTAKD